MITFDSLTRAFTFEHTTDLSPLIDPLSEFIDYTVTVSGTSGLVNPTEVSQSFVLRVKNPCYDPLFVSIDAQPLPVGEQYLLYDFSAALPYSFQHNPFSVVTAPFQHSLCG